MRQQPSQHPAAFEGQYRLRGPADVPEGQPLGRRVGRPTYVARMQAVRERAVGAGQSQGQCFRFGSHPRRVRNREIRIKAAVLGGSHDYLVGGVGVVFAEQSKTPVDAGWRRAGAMSEYFVNGKDARSRADAVRGNDSILFPFVVEEYRFGVDREQVDGGGGIEQQAVAAHRRHPCRPCVEPEFDSEFLPGSPFSPSLQSGQIRKEELLRQYEVLLQNPIAGIRVARIRYERLVAVEPDRDERFARQDVVRRAGSGDPDLLQMTEHREIEGCRGRKAVPKMKSETMKRP